MHKIYSEHLHMLDAHQLLHSATLSFCPNAFDLPEIRSEMSSRHICFNDCFLMYSTSCILMNEPNANALFHCPVTLYEQIRCIFFSLYGNTEQDMT